MGILLSRFRKKKTTIEILDDLDKKIRDIEQYRQNTEQRHKKIVGTLIIYSVALYVITALVFYFYFFPAKLYDQLFYITPLLIFPLLILFTKKIVSWYYKRKLSKNQEKLISMQKEKKKILDEVTETETYKKAKEILMKFAPDQLQSTYVKSPAAHATPKTCNPQSSVSVLETGIELRRRVLTSINNTQHNSSKLAPPILLGSTLTDTTLSPTGYKTSGKLIDAVTPETKAPLPRPILPQQRSYIDRLVEYVIGDGPNNRYALICRQCDSHNGMALKEEFEYFAFRCCYCNFWNPARKQKPSAPKLEFDNSLIASQRLSFPFNKSTENFLQTNAEPESKANLSDTDSDIEVVEKPSVTSDSEENNISGDGESDNVEIAEQVIKTEFKKIEEIESETMKVDKSPK